jgi:hypothetical protein
MGLKTEVLLKRMRFSIEDEEVEVNWFFAYIGEVRKIESEPRRERVLFSELPKVRFIDPELILQGHKRKLGGGREMWGVGREKFKYVCARDILKRSNMQHSKPVTTPIETDTKLLKEDDEEAIDATLYNQINYRIT